MRRLLFAALRGCSILAPTWAPESSFPLSALPFPAALGQHRRMSEPAQQPIDAEWITEADIIRAAKLVIDLRGAGARDRARHRVGDLRLTGDHEAAEIWLRIAKAIEQLPATMPTVAKRPDEGAGGGRVFRGGLLRNPQHW